MYKDNAKMESASPVSAIGAFTQYLSAYQNNDIQRSVPQTLSLNDMGHKIMREVEAVKTPAQRQQVEAHLADKWAIYADI